MLHQRCKGQKASTLLKLLFHDLQPYLPSETGRERCPQSCLPNLTQVHLTGRAYFTYRTLPVILKCAPNNKEKRAEYHVTIWSSDRSIITFALPDAEAKCDLSLITGLALFLYMPLLSSFTFHFYTNLRIVAQFRRYSIHASCKGCEYFRF